ncbi:hypothetical protein RP20_CCG013401 [Aedes albopictus]|nr:hypothetical protein RP20_CCG013401 [Aedes albopictus]
MTIVVGFLKASAAISPVVVGYGCCRTVVDTGAAKRHSSSHPVTTTAISAASPRVDGNQRKQAFLLCLVEEAPQQVAQAAVAVK